MKLSGKGTGEIQYRAVFLEASRLLNPSVPYLGLLFPSYSPPILFSVNCITIRLLPRISVTLENLHRFYFLLSGKEWAGGIKRSESLRMRYR